MAGSEQILENTVTGFLGEIYTPFILTQKLKIDRLCFFSSAARQILFYPAPCATPQSNRLIQFNTILLQRMSSNMHFKQFACGFAMFELELDDEATDGWSATFSEMRNDERMEEIEGEEGSAVEVEGAAQFLA